MKAFMSYVIYHNNISSIKHFPRRRSSSMLIVTRNELNFYHLHHLNPDGTSPQHRSGVQSYAAAALFALMMAFFISLVFWSSLHEKSQYLCLSFNVFRSDERGKVQATNEWETPKQATRLKGNINFKLWGSGKQLKKFLQDRKAL